MLPGRRDVFHNLCQPDSILLHFKLFVSCKTVFCFKVIRDRPNILQQQRAYINECLFTRNTNNWEEKHAVTGACENGFNSTAAVIVKFCDRKGNCPDTTVANLLNAQE